MKRVWAFIFVAVFLVLLLPVQAPAVTLNLGYVFSGDTPTGASPWLTVNIGNITGGVRIDLVNGLKSSSEFISAVYLNVNPALNPSLFTLNLLGGSTISSAMFRADCCKADGDGYYDIRLDFPTSSSGNRFLMGETASLSLLYPGLTESDFVFLSAPDGAGAGLYYAAAHVQGIPQDGDGSSWIGSTGPETPQEPVPEPASLLLIGSGLLAGWWRSRRS